MCVCSTREGRLGQRGVGHVFMGKWAPKHTVTNWSGKNGSWIRKKRAREKDLGLWNGYKQQWTEKERETLVKGMAAAFIVLVLWLCLLSMNGLYIQTLLSKAVPMKTESSNLHTEARAIHKQGPRVLHTCPLPMWDHDMPRPENGLINCLMGKCMPTVYVR